MNDNSMVMTMVTNTNMNSGRKKKRSFSTLARIEEHRDPNMCGPMTTGDTTLSHCAHFLLCNTRDQKRNGKRLSVIDRFQ